VTWSQLWRAWARILPRGRRAKARMATFVARVSARLPFRHFRSHQGIPGRSDSDDLTVSCFIRPGRGCRCRFRVAGFDALTAFHLGLRGQFFPLSWAKRLAAAIQPNAAAFQRVYRFDASSLLDSIADSPEASPGPGAIWSRPRNITVG